MSRAYRLRIQESLRRVIRSGDSISIKLEMIGIVSPEETSQLLAAALEQKGFEKNEDGTLCRRDGDVAVTVDTNSGEVTLRTNVEQDVHLVQEDSVLISEEAREAFRERVVESGREKLRAELEETASRLEKQLQADAADKLDAALGDVRKELDQIVNRVTIEALKLKARRMGRIKELSEDAESGSLTIVVEV